MKIAEHSWRFCPSKLLTANVWIFIYAVLSFLLHQVNGQDLKLKVDPIFEVVNENWTIGRALPDLSICVSYTGVKQLTLTVTNGDALGYFYLSSVNSSCWTLILQKQLDADLVNPDGSRGQSFSLALKCTDGKVQSYGNLDIQIVDINDNAPRFVDTESAISVPEDKEVGSHLFTVTTFDPDTGVGGIDSFILEDDFQKTFEIRNGSCNDGNCFAELHLNRKLNYDLKNIYTLNVVAFDGAGRSPIVNVAKFPVVINVADVENNPPRFVTDSRLQRVQENALVGSTVVQVQAIDGDVGVAHPNRILYKLLQPSRYFDINATTGWIYVKSALDRESVDVLKSGGTVTLQIQAEEDSKETPRPKSNLTVSILITDVDDERPRCNLTTYNAKMVENSQRLMPLTFTNAQDLYVFDNDEGVNGEFTLSLSGVDDIFDISPKRIYNVGTAVIRVNNSRKLDYEEKQLLGFRIVLTPSTKDDKSTPSFCDVLVRVLDANDNAPMFEQPFYHGFIEENSPIGTAVTRITASDLDSVEFGPLAYFIKGVGAENFGVDTNGTVRSAVVLDHELGSEYNLTVFVVDDGGRGNSNSTSLMITVKDVNDNPPIFSKSVYMVSILENSVEFNLIGNEFFVEAFDEDEPNTDRSNVTFELKKGYGSENFTINKFTGQLIPKLRGVDLEFMTADYFNLTVVAKDSDKVHPLSSSATVLIYVNDTNDNEPIFDQPVYNISIYENATSESILVALSATDNDRSHFNSLIAYRISNIQDKFMIDSETGALSLADGVSLDQEANRLSRYKLDVIAVDQGFPPSTGEATVFISVIDINDKLPRFPEKVYHVDVVENAPVHTSLVNLSASDPDTDNRLVYHIVGFREAQAEDGSGIDINEYNYTTLFFVKPFTGELITAKPLDREFMEHVIIVVNVTDVNAEMNKPQTAQTLVDLLITDVNDNAPTFIKSDAIRSVQENAEIGSLIMTVTAWDADRNRTISYSLAKNSSNLVKIDEYSGELTVSGLIDYETVRTINFTVIAADSGVPGLSSSVDISLKVLDQNDNSPIFALPRYSANVSEDVANGTVVLSISAIDKDSGMFGVVSYFLLNEVASPAPFAINSTTGAITVDGVLDREMKSVYTLTIKAVDHYSGHLNTDSHEATTVAVVNVMDVNDNAPLFVVSTSQTLVLNERNQAGMQVTVLTAIDDDDEATGNGQVQYRIVGGNATVAKTQKPMFILDGQSGALKLATNLTGLYGSYELIVEASDKGLVRPLATKHSINVEVQDFNDHPPKIVQPPKQAVFSVAENNYTDYFVITQVLAIDKDHGKNAELRYRLKPTGANSDWKYFKINEITGEVYLKQALDFERQNKYVVTTEACDDGQPQLCDELEFAIIVADKDDNCPYFKRHQNFTQELGVQENLATGSIVGSVMEANDKDTAVENIRMCYDIVAGDGATLFSMLSRNSTKIITKSVLDRESKSSYEVVVRVSDCQNNRICADESSQRLTNDKVQYKSEDSSLLNVRIKVFDVNDNSPSFVQSMFIGGVQYDTKIGSRVTRIKAVDVDEVDQGKLFYFAQGQTRIKLQKQASVPSRAPFSVNSTTGDIMSAILFDPSWNGLFEVTVGVTDTGNRSASAVVVINLLSYDQQVELLFESNANHLWEDAFKIIQLLSIITESNATIDDIQAYQSDVATVSNDRMPQSKVLVHFVSPNSEIMPVEMALQLLDLPQTTEQKRAKQELISVHRLKYAGHNPDPLIVVAGDSDSVHYGLSGALAGLLLVLVVLISIWCVQNRIYRRRLKAATAVSYNTGDLTIPSYDVPGTNLHANTNPVWTPTYGEENFGVEFDVESDDSKNSLDENHVEQEADGNYVTNQDVIPSMLHKHGQRQMDMSQSQFRSPQDQRITFNNLSSEKSFVSNNNNRTLSPQPHFPKPIMSNLESTEL